MAVSSHRPIKTERAGMTKCLGINCGRIFKSPDAVNTRFCVKCRNRKYRDDHLLVFRFTPSDRGRVQLIH